jgi:hypothetical protein
MLHIVLLNADNRQDLFLGRDVIEADIAYRGDAGLGIALT